MDYQDTEKEALKKWFKTFAENECKQISPLYYDLSTKIAQDEELISIASHCRYRQPMPNLFLAAVHYLLLQGKSNELANYYPSITPNFSQELPFELFKQFCLQNKYEIIDLEQSKLVQTNSLNRAAYIMPIISNLFDGKEINIVDIGTSAGLTLNFDKYEYHYNNEYCFGKSPVKIRSEIREGILPYFTQPVKINRKIGIDQNPLDLKIQENADWLKALIWADLTERIEKIEEAIKIAKQEKIQFEKSDKVQGFQEIIQSQEKQIPLVIYHTHALYQFSPEARKEFWGLIDRIGKERELTYLATEWHSVLQKEYGVKSVLVELNEYKKGRKTTRLVAETNGHANWLKWN